jgi:hypothetical protein
VTPPDPLVVQLTEISDGWETLTKTLAEENGTLRALLAQHSAEQAAWQARIEARLDAIDATQAAILDYLTKPQAASQPLSFVRPRRA